MIGNPGDSAAREREFNQILAELMRTIDDGKPVDAGNWLDRYPEFSDELTAFFEKHERVEKIIRPIRRAAARALHVRCPHCHNPIELLDESPIEGISCPSCGSNFSLVGQDAGSEFLNKERTLGHFELVERVGVGQFGAVWKSRDTKLDRTVAIKIPRSGSLGHGQTSLFLRDARASAQLTHPNIVSVHEVGKHNDTVYIVSDFIHGVTLREWLADRQLAPREAAELCVKIADALKHAHEAGVIHRDLKPGNIMMDTADEPHLVDFGLAKREAGEITMTIEGQILGTPAYMSPEQARGEGHTVDRRADIYSLGVILFEMLTGELPFRGDNRMLIVQILDEEPPSPRTLNSSLPRDLETICLKCLEKDPKERFEADGLIGELKRFLLGQPIRSRPISRSARVWTWCRRNQVAATLGAAVMILLLIISIGGLVVGVRQTWLAQQNESLAAAEVAARIDEQKKTEALEARTAELTRQLHVEASVRLLSESKSHQDESPVRSLLLGVEAVNVTHQQGEAPVVDAHELLLNAPSFIGGEPLTGHNSAVRMVKISPNGRWAATLSGANVRLWNLTVGEPSATKPSVIAHRAWISSVKISDDSQWIASASTDGMVRVSRLTAGSGNAGKKQTDHRELQHGSMITSIAIGTNDQTLIAAGVDGLVRVWDLKTEPPTKRVLRGHVGAIHSIVVSPDGRWLITSGYKEVRRWDLRADDPASTSSPLPGHEGDIPQIAICGNKLISSTRDGTTLIWELNASVLRSPAMRLRTDSGGVTAMAISLDGRWLAAAGLHRSVRVWDLFASTPQASSTVLLGHEDYVTSMGFSSDARWLVTGSADGTARIWNIRDDRFGTPKYVLRGHEGPVVSVAVSPDDRCVITGSQDTTARIWNLRNPTTWSAPSNAVLFGINSRWLVTKERLYDLRRTDPSATPVEMSKRRTSTPSASPRTTISRNGRWLVEWTFFGSYQKTAKYSAPFQISDLLSDYPDKTTHTLMVAGRVKSVAITSNGRWLAAVVDGHTQVGERSRVTILCWDLTSESPPIQLDPGAWSVGISDDGRWVIGSYGDDVRIWERDEPSVARRLPGRLTAISSNSRWLVTTPKNKPPLLWDLKALGSSLSPVELTIDRSAAEVKHVTRDGEWLVTGNQGNTIWVWDLRKGDPASAPIAISSKAHIKEVSIARNGRWLATADEDNFVRLWELRASDRSVPAVSLQGSDAQVTALALGPDGRWLIVGRSDKTARLWDLRSLDREQKPLRLRPKTIVRKAAISPDGEWAVTSGRLWNLNIDSLIGRAIRIAGRKLTPEERQQHLDLLGIVHDHTTTSENDTASTDRVIDRRADSAHVRQRDWPMWGGTADRNMVTPGWKASVDFEPPRQDVNEKEMPAKKLLWSARLGSQTYGQAVVANEKVFVGTNNGGNYRPQHKGDRGCLLCFDESNGEFLWQLTREKLQQGRVNDWPLQGIVSVPCVEGDRLWIVTNRAELMCLDTEGFRDGENDGAYTSETDREEQDADIVWSLDMMEDLGVFPHNLAISAPVVHGDLVFIVTGNGVDEAHLEIPTPRAPAFLAVNKNSGEVVWEDNSPFDRVLHGQWSSPAIGIVNGQPQIYMAGGDAWLYAFEPTTGGLIWKFDLNPKNARWELGGRGTRNSVIATPVFHDNSVVLAVGQDPEHGEGVGHLYRIDATRTGDVSRQRPDGSANPTSAQMWQYGGEDEDGAVSGRIGAYIFRRTLSTVAIENGLVYAADLTGYIHCVNFETGKRYWEYDTLSAIWGSPMVVDDKVFLGDEDGDLVVLRAGKRLEMLAEKFFPSSIYSTPVIVNGRLFVVDRSRLYAFQAD